ncbi:Hypothetical protein predicted by Glimmer/Critica [Sorangium cellulosum So ce56]|uniref:Uncharacterized protein n=2 Tax=Sorangium cellulosum TaxID=56 RepID=A9G2J7_SORC5|nr:Hypothetical protein predicted by Glimmer/Critica [Sorangium cellulosum So ce56]
MKTRIFLRAFGLAVCGLAVAACASGDDGGGSGGAGGSGSAGSTTSSSGTVDPSTTTASTGTTDAAATSSSASTTASTGAGAGPQTIEMIDDMEDNDNAILAKGGRVGYWYTFNDGSAGAKQTPPPDPDGTGEEPFTMTALAPARGQSTYAARSWGEGFETWGAGFGFELNSPEGAKTAYDASAYTGITFWAKIGAGSATSASVMISDPGTDPAGGSCSDECDKWQKSLTLTEEWQQFTIPFAELKQGGWGDPAGTDQIDATKLYAIQFQVGIAPKFDLYIDDLGFYN